MIHRHRYPGSRMPERSPVRAAYGDPLLLAMYRSMARIRRVQEGIVARYRFDRIKNPVHLALGQEATAVGMALALERKDTVWISHRSHGPYLAKGGSLRTMLSELYCRADGCTGSRGGGMHLLDPAAGIVGGSAIVAGSIPIAVGAALAFRLRGERRVSCAFFGDGATEQGACSESLNFSALRRLPVVFFCENNFYSSCSPIEYRQPEGVEIWRRSEGFGLPSTCVDGTNVLDVYDAAAAAVRRAREGGGPAFIEARVCRYLAHSGASDDSATGYRDPQEPVEWRRLGDPIEQFSSRLRAEGLLDDRAIAKVDEEIASEVEAEFQRAEGAPAPDPGAVLDHVYAD